MNKSSYALSATTYYFEDKEVQVLLPDNNPLKELYTQRAFINNKIDFPYWTKIWPASIALCKFISANPTYLLHKSIVELAAGLGLPSLLAAQYAKQVLCSDYNADAVWVIEQSINLNRLNNIACSIIDWHNLPPNFNPDVLILSDVNYEPNEFHFLQNLINQLIEQGSLIILSTPHRLVAKSFVLPLLHYCIQKENYAITQENIIIETSVFVFKHPKLY